MIRNENEKIIKLTAQKLLLSIFKLGTPFFRADGVYRHSANQLVGEINIAQQELTEKIRYLKATGYIKKFSQNKTEYIELTNKGISRIKKIQQETLPVKRPKKWDGKWRIVIYDIPKGKNLLRDRLRRILVRSHFLKIQESVYVLPFPCAEEMEQLIKELKIGEHVDIFVARAILSEEKLIKSFFDLEMLTKSDLESK